jgi:bilirubin oxidase
MKNICCYLALLFGLLIIPEVSGQNPLFIPQALSGEEINLSFQTGQASIFEGFTTNTLGYNQDFLGPTLILEQGNDITFNVTNTLSETTTVHWHGLHVAPENDGGPHTPIEAGETWSPSFTVMDAAATYWYHPHLHEHTEEQVTKGGAGFIIVKDAEESALALPRMYGIDDFPLLLQSKAFDTDKQFMIETPLDNILLCNGTKDAFLDAPAQVLRFRLLNGSTERVYNLGFSENLSFQQIATDGGLLDAPVELSRLRLAPGERAEILVDLSTLQGQSIDLVSFASELPNGIYGAANGSAMGMASIPNYSNNELNGNDFTLLNLNVVAPTSDAITSIPSSLITNEIYAETDVQATRSLTFRPVQMGPTGMANGPFEINDAVFDMDVFNFEIPLNNTEIWELTNFTAVSHPFHIHDVQFFILDIDGVAPSLNMQGKKDVVLVPPMGGTVRFITKFEDFANNDVPYMYHCHMLSHEDAGMMGQFIVFDEGTSSQDNEEDIISIFPNPTSNILFLENLQHSTLSLTDATGKVLEIRNSISEKEQINLEKYPSGIYYIQVINYEKSWVYKVVKI